MSIDLLVADLAARQLGVFTRAQVSRVGVTDDMIRGRVGNGRWGVMHPGVFRLAGTPPTYEQARLASWLAAGPGAAVSFDAAGHVWELPGVRPALDVSVLVPRQPRLRGVSVHRVRALDPVDVVRRDSLAVTTPTRTLLDLAGRLEPPRLERAVDHCLSRRLTTVPYLARRIAAIGPRGRAGVVQLGEILAARPPGFRPPESDFERALVAALAGLPGPPAITQYEVILPDGRVIRFDVAYPDDWVALEGDSYTYHSSHTDWARDQTKRNMLVAIGWRVLPITYYDVTQRRAWVREIVQRARNRELCARTG